MNDTNEKGLVQYETLSGDTIKLSASIVRNYLVETGSLVNDQEIMMFLSLCKFQKLNPFLREVYLIKYGNKPANMVVGKEAFLKRAVRSPRYEGHETGIEGEGEDMQAWASVFVKGYRHPLKVTVDYSEYVARNKDGAPNKIWSEKPKTMLRKVALCQALREAFPDECGGMYSQEEINTINHEDLPNTPIKINEEK